MTLSVDSSQRRLHFQKLLDPYFQTLLDRAIQRFPLLDSYLVGEFLLTATCQKYASDIVSV